jgi:RNA polymerase sigma factor (sigma-70 family)
MGEQAEATTPTEADRRTLLLYHFCRLRLPFVALPAEAFARQLRRAFGLFQAKRLKEGLVTTWDAFLDGLHAVDAFLSAACLAGDARAWEALFAARVSRSDALLVDALRARAVRLFPRNKQLSDLRHGPGPQALPDDDHAAELPRSDAADERWHEEFRSAAAEWLAELSDQEVLILGLRLRYRLSQREAAQLLGIHEGNVSRQTNRLRDHCLERIGQRLQEQGWSGDDLSGFILTEMDGLLLDEPRLAADRLAALLAARKKKKAE